MGEKDSVQSAVASPGKLRESWCGTWKSVSGLAMIAWISVTAMSSAAEKPGWEDFAPGFSTNTLILWHASISDVPKSFWIYKKLPTLKVFSSKVISNAIVLGSLQSHGFPQASTNEIVIDEQEGCPCGHAVTFLVEPKSAALSYSMSNANKKVGGEILPDDVLVRRAWRAAFDLGLYPNQLGQKEPVDHFCSYDEKGAEVTNHVPCGRGVLLSRRIDGTDFIGNGDDGFSMEGFYMEFGNGGKIRTFDLIWPDLARTERQSTASKEEIVQCIRAQRVCVLPEPYEDELLQKVKTLVKARTFIITKITPYYAEYGFVENPTNSELATIVAPVAVLDCVADFGNSNMTARVYAPILLSDVTQLLKMK